ncbi:hypothetical protein IFR05_011950 [Cadophora sp. M221]|nr:hypothetical protein IFR05_011950 [Cadophora sp. M221]
MLNHGECLKITELEMRQLKRQSQDQEFTVFGDVLRELSAPVPERQRQRRLKYPIMLYPDYIVDIGNLLMRDQIATPTRMVESLGTERAWRFEVIYRGYANLGHGFPWKPLMVTPGRFEIS